MAMPMVMLMKWLETAPVLEFEEVLVWFNFVNPTITWVQNWYVRITDTTPEWYSSDYKRYKFNILTKELIFVDILSWMPSIQNTAWQISWWSNYFISWMNNLSKWISNVYRYSLGNNIQNILQNCNFWVRNPQLTLDWDYIYKRFWYTLSNYISYPQPYFERYNLFSNTWEILPNWPSLFTRWKWIKYWNYIYMTWVSNASNTTFVSLYRFDTINLTWEFINNINYVNYTNAWTKLWDIMYCFSYENKLVEVNLLNLSVTRKVLWFSSNSSVSSTMWWYDKIYTIWSNKIWIYTKI